MAKFFRFDHLNSLIIIKLHFSQQEHVQMFSLPSPRKTCVLPFDFTLKRDRKISLIISVTLRIIWTRSSVLYLIDMNIYTRNLRSLILVSILMLQVYLTFSLFFKIWLTESILISREYLLRETCFLLASNTLPHTFFPM